jgi:hypothetical protein
MKNKLKIEQQDIKSPTKKGKNWNTGAYRDGYHVNSKYWKNYKKS